MTSAEDDLRRMIAQTESAAENDVAQLTKVYESMKPKQAAALFEEMDPVFAAGFLARMRPEAAADVLAGLSPGAAHGISVILAGRNATVPRE
ncbi:MAG: MotE family protein [Roseovarius sp.]